MSCRVLGRKVEQAMLAELVAAARCRGITRIVGTYRPTPRNELVKDHYEKLGFARQSEAADGTTVWTLDVAGMVSPAVPMRVQRLGIEHVG
jgi:predicted enzyme involved in methoxymalonyl-ACP biosynthesis